MSNESHFNSNTNAGQTREVSEIIKPTESKLLGPDGKPLQYIQPKFGFDLTPRKNKEKK